MSPDWVFNMITTALGFGAMVCRLSPYLKTRVCKEYILRAGDVDCYNLFLNTMPEKTLCLGFPNSDNWNHLTLYTPLADGASVREVAAGGMGERCGQ